MKKKGKGVVGRIPGFVLCCTVFELVTTRKQKDRKSPYLQGNAIALHNREVRKIGKKKKRSNPRSERSRSEEKVKSNKGHYETPVSVDRGANLRKGRGGGDRAGDPFLNCKNVCRRRRREGQRILKWNKRTQA